MDRVVRHAIANGLSPMTALQMSTLNTAEHFGLAREIGQIAPGRWADILLVKDLADFKPEMVIGKGVLLAVESELKATLPQMEYPHWAIGSIHLKRTLQPADFKIKVKETATSVKVNVIGVTENQAPTRRLVYEFQPVNGEIRVDTSRDVIKLAVVERHTGSGVIQVGMVTGFGFSARGAVASTVAHDCHQMIVMGTDDREMSLAANTLAEMGGGQVVVRDGAVIGRVALPIAGLMSNQRADKVAAQAQTVLDGFKACGCLINNPNMTMSLLALVVIPELRLSDKGLVDVNTFSFIPVVQD
jgi:adenine deaminase